MLLTLTYCMSTVVWQGQRVATPLLAAKHALQCALWDAEQQLFRVPTNTYAHWCEAIDREMHS